MRQAEMFCGPLRQVLGTAIVRYPGTKRKAYFMILECGHTAYRKNGVKIPKRLRCLGCLDLDHHKNPSTKGTECGLYVKNL
jgi:hypothetical protein